MNAIELKEINKIYRTDEIETLALENVNLAIEKGEFVSVMGPSGCGKSTLLNIVGLLDEPTSGSVIIDNTTIGKMSDSKLAAFRNSKLGFVFQSFHLINSLNVLDNVELPLIYRSMSASERQRRVREVLERVGLSHRRTDRQPRLKNGRRGNGSAPQSQQGRRTHYHDGDPQRTAGPSDRPHHPFLRRPSGAVTVSDNKENNIQ